MSSTDADAIGSSRITWRSITTPTICAAAACTRSGSTGADGVGDPADQGSPDELAQHRGALLAGHRRPEHAEHRRPELGLSQAPKNSRTSRSPRPSGSPASTSAAARRVERQLHGGDEHLLLGAEVVVHQCRVDPACRAMPRTLAAAYPFAANCSPRGGQDRRTPVAAVCRPAGAAARGGRHRQQPVMRPSCLPLAATPRAGAGPDGGAVSESREPRPTCAPLAGRLLLPERTRSGLEGGRCR